MRQFYGRLEKCVLSAGKPVSIKFFVLRGGVFWVWGGGADFIFMGAGIFLRRGENRPKMVFIREFHDIINPLLEFYTFCPISYAGECLTPLVLTPW